MLLTSRTPLRVSFFGGGTDYPEYFARRRGAVVGMAIDKYIYASALPLTNILEYRWRVAYRRVEMVDELSDIQHPVVREVLGYYGIKESLDISIISDLPGGTGLGSSSSFTVGLLNLIFRLRERRATKFDLAKEAIKIEREVLRENVGVQDQYHASFGGINRFDFEAGRTRISPVQIVEPCLEALTSSLFLLYTGQKRSASGTLTEQMERTRGGLVDRDLSHLVSLTEQAVDVLEGGDPHRMLREFGAMLHEGWETKKRLASNVSNPSIDTLYDAARDAGALGGKLCGAGAGGFLLMLVPPWSREGFSRAVTQACAIPVGLDTSGSTILTG